MNEDLQSSGENNYSPEETNLSVTETKEENNLNSSVEELPKESNFNNDVGVQKVDDINNNESPEEKKQLSLQEQLYGNQVNNNIAPNVTQINNTYPIESEIPYKKKKSTGLIVGIVLVLVLLLGGAYVFITMNNPTTVYRTMLKDGFNLIYEAFNEEYESVDATIDLGLNLDFKENVIDESLVDLFNKTKVKLNYQMDKSNNQLVFNLDANYDKDKLIDIKMFVDGKNNKLHLYAEDFYDKYIEVSSDEDVSLEESLDILFNSGNILTVKVKNSSKAKDIVIKELTENLIKSTDTSKENKEYVYKISSKEFSKRLITIMNNLKNNSGFLNCFESEDEVKAYLDSATDDVDLSYMDDSELKITLNKGLLSKTFNTLVIEENEERITLENVRNDKVNYKYESDEEVIASGYIKTTTSKNTEKVELLMQIPELVDITVNVDTEIKKLSGIDKVNESKIKNINELTEEEIMGIFEKLMSSKLYEVISAISLNASEYSEISDLPLSYWVKDTISYKPSVTVISSRYCSHCKNFEPIMTELSNKYKFKLYYFDIEALTEEELYVLTSTYDIDYIGAVPLTFATVGGELLETNLGFMDKNESIDFLKKADVIE